MIITKRNFIKLFTVDEYATIKNATTQSSVVDYFWQLFMVAEDVDLSDPDTMSGLNSLESIGLLAPGRANEITNPVPVFVPVIAPATVYLRDGNFITVPENEAPPSSYEASWPVSALVAQLIAEGAQIRGSSANIEIFATVGN